MSHRFHSLAAAFSLGLAFSAHAAKPAKPAVKPVAAVEFELAHNLGAVGEQSLQAIIDRYNKESGSQLKLVRLEKGSKPVSLNLVRRYDMSDVLSEKNAFVPIHEMMKKA
ncbi:MAG: hypothetical protein Q8R95_01895, partial [Azonexus sp.]|nr:hypothetical protein [Azonexus sp.]